MKIAQISSDQLPVPPRQGGAIETYIWEISKRLSEGNTVHIFSLRDKSVIANSEKVFFHTFKKAKKLFPFLSLYGAVVPLTFKLSKMLVDAQRAYGAFDVIHSHYLGTALAPIIVKRFFRTKSTLVLSIHGEYSGNFLDRFILSEYDVIIAVSESIKRGLVKKFYLNPSKIRVLHNGVDTALFRYDDESVKFKNEMELKNSKIILYVGRIVPEKGLLVLVESLPTILSVVPSVKLLIIGPKGNFAQEQSDYLEKIFKTASELKISDSIIYLGSFSHQKLRIIYSMADVCVIPSLCDEAFGLVIVEAMSCSRPVVAFEVGGIPEIIINGANGFLVRKGDRKALAERIAQLLNDPDKCFQLGKTGRVTVEKRFSFDNVCNVLQEIYKKSMGDAVC